MLKTIKTVKKLRLDELIKYVWDNDIYDECYFSNRETNVCFIEKGEQVYIQQEGQLEKVINKEELFEVEVKEEVTEDTEFDLLIEVYEFGKSNEVESVTYEDTCISSVKTQNTKRIYTFVGGEPLIIWERD